MEHVHLNVDAYEWMHFECLESESHKELHRVLTHKTHAYALTSVFPFVTQDCRFSSGTFHSIYWWREIERREKFTALNLDPFIVWYRRAGPCCNGKRLCQPWICKGSFGLINALEIITQEQAAHITLLIYPSRTYRQSPKRKVKNLNYSGAYLYMISVCDLVHQLGFKISLESVCR